MKGSSVSDPIMMMMRLTAQVGGAYLIIIMIGSALTDDT
jgi:hypothetical protein